MGFRLVRTKPKPGLIFKTKTKIGIFFFEKLNPKQQNSKFFILFLKTRIGGSSQ
jgi:hypothetical protein